MTDGLRVKYSQSIHDSSTRLTPRVVTLGSDEFLAGPVEPELTNINELDP
jgi:hypothetical protein